MIKPRSHGKPPWVEGRGHFKQNAVRFIIHLLGWTGIAVLYYIGFSFLFDTPIEHRIKRSTKKLEREYKVLNLRYDSLEQVLENVVERDRNVFRILFEAEPYNIRGEHANARWESSERLLGESNRGMGDEFMTKIQRMEQRLSQLISSYNIIEQKSVAMGGDALYIPSIQPVVNSELTLLTASYGMRIHPFYKTLTSHTGVDYTIVEGSRVFATADGTVRDIINHSSSGTTLIITHANGYETMYAHLSKINVGKGAKVRRGDIVALSGNTGLSLAPHLHYEVRHNGMRVDPIHYFFMELTPVEYQQIIKIAQSGMQSFD